MSNPGKWVVGTIVVVALVAAMVAWTYTYRQGQRVLRLWGADAARRIRLAPEGELWALVPADSTDSTVALDNQHGVDSATVSDRVDAAAELVIGHRRWKISRRVPLEHAPGFIHARQALIDDQSYRWDVTPQHLPDVDWQYALRFRDQTGQTQLVFDLQRSLVMEIDQLQAANIEPITPGLLTYFAERLGSTP